MVACLVRDQEAVGSNPATPTTYKEAESLIYQGFSAFSFSQILDFGVYCFKKFIFSGFIFIKISELASSTDNKNNGTLSAVYRLFLCLLCAVLFER